ncbi:MAG TPA: bifunctional diaminohydroxyphosphoribosylaminopyrimidine deaminase/5-amino-6-(5-phosphoribosylamino)uracil reductase RibD [Dehalococcoidia bacterium]|nr:bifunctional diaminohydroxyphosphoribosylaminopyrimidine deaminase/5-amino-6-(5-phosphoribosylamino)uracil reductase RibD [Dehalococcoidia bacterium]
MVMPPQQYMECALSLAKLAMGYTSPNPAVGAVVVKDGLAVGMGYTQPAGSEHAEVMALRQAGDKAQGATMYVTLEPCSHYGRTPPCTQAIIDASISEIYIALLDPNPVVSGHGIGKLNEVGIKTHIGICQQEASEINEAYIKHITTGLPFVVAKFAMSLDGKIATKTGDSKWITNEEARKYAHALRYTVDAIMVGVNTIIADNPHLTAKGCGGRGGIGKMQPLRLVVDSKGRVPLNAHIFESPGEVLLAVAAPFDSVKKGKFVEAGAEVLELPAREGSVDIVELLNLLGKREIVTVLVEGGGKLLGSLFDHHLVDKVLAFISPIIIGGCKAVSVGGDGVDNMAKALRLSRIDIKNLGDDILVSGYVEKRLPKEA